MEERLLKLRELLVGRGLTRKEEEALFNRFKIGERRFKSRILHYYGGHVRYLDKDSPFFLGKLESPTIITPNRVNFPSFLRREPNEEILLSSILNNSFLPEWRSFFKFLDDNFSTDVVFQYGDEYCSEILESFFSLWRWTRRNGENLDEELDLEENEKALTAFEFMVAFHNTKSIFEAFEYIVSNFDFTPEKDGKKLFRAEKSPSITNKKENKMFNFGNLFKTVDLTKVRMTMLGMGIENENGEVLIYNQEEGSLTNATDFQMDFGEGMVFAFPSQSIKVGDLVVNGSRIVFVTNVAGNKITCIDYETEQEVTMLKKKHPMFGHFAQKVICPMGSLFSGLGEGEGENGLIKMLMFSSMMGNRHESQNDMFQMIMMSQLFKEGDSPFGDMFKF